MDPTTTGWIVGVAVFVALLFLVVTRRRDRDPLGQAPALPTLPPARSLSVGELAELREINERVGKIAAIKRLREIRDVGLADAKKVIDILAAGGTTPIDAITTVAASTAGARAASTDSLPPGRCCFETRRVPSTPSSTCANTPAWGWPMRRPTSTPFVDPLT